VLNVFNLVEWRFDLLIPARSRQFGANVNPRMATLTRGSGALKKLNLQPKQIASTISQAE